MATEHEDSLASLVGIALLVLRAPTTAGVKPGDVITRETFS